MNRLAPSQSRWILGIRLLPYGDAPIDSANVQGDAGEHVDVRRLAVTNNFADAFRVAIAGIDSVEVRSIDVPNDLRYLMIYADIGDPPDPHLIRLDAKSNLVFEGSIPDLYGGPPRYISLDLNSKPDAD